jgi:uncharacterized protein (TIGR02246 family)
MPAKSPEEVQVLIRDALSSGDLEAVVSLYEADAALVPSGQPSTDPIRGKAALREVSSQFLAMKPRITTEPTKVIKSGDIALVIGEWTLTAKGPDGDVSMSGTYTDVMRRQADGSWLFVIDNLDGVA